MPHHKIITHSKWISSALALGIVASTPASAQAELIDSTEAGRLSIAEINISGLNRTDEHVVLREITLQANDQFNANTLENSIQKLRNLRLFSQVESEILLTEQDRIDVHLKLKEKWTTIPVIKYTQGGNSSYFVAGLYDINTLGKYIETGAQYESWNGNAGGVVWFRNPRLFDKNLRLSTDIWSVNRPRELYNNQGESQASYLLQRSRFNFSIENELNSSLAISSGLTLDHDKLEAVTIGDTLDPQLQAQLQQSARTNIMGIIGMRFGKLNYNNLFVTGKVSENKLTHTLPVSENRLAFYRFETVNQSFWTLPAQANLGIQLRAGITNAQALQYQFYIGGFENIRGYYDGQFRSDRFWQLNTEYRLPLMNTRLFAIQGSSFVDIAQTADTREAFFSAGGGLRMGSPHIYRFVSRLDITLLTSHPASSRISFGVQQFF